MRRLAATTLTLLVLLASAAAPGHAVVTYPGDLLITGQSAGTGTPYVAVVDRVSGAAQIISSGGLIVAPWMVTADDQFVYVGNPSNIIRIDPSNGNQTVFSTNLVGTVNNTTNMICHSNGFIYFTAAGNVYRVDRVSGAQTNLTAAGNPFVTGICEGPDGQIYGSCEVTTPAGVVSTRRIDPMSGAWTNASYGAVAKPRGIGFDQRDSLYVESSSNRAVYRIDLAAQAVGQLSPTTNDYTAAWMVAHPDGYLYFTHLPVSGPRIDRMDTVTGVRIALPTSPVLGPSIWAISYVPFATTSTNQTSWGRLKERYR